MSSGHGGSPQVVVVLRREIPLSLPTSLFKVEVVAIIQRCRAGERSIDAELKAVSKEKRRQYSSLAMDR